MSERRRRYIGHARHLALQRSSHRLRAFDRIALDADEEGGLIRVELSRREIVVHVRLVAELMRLDVLGDADNGSTGHRVGVQSNTFADQILPRPDRVRHRLAHHDHQWRVLQVRRQDSAAAQNARPHRREVAWRDGVHVEPSQSRDGIDAGDEQTHAPRAPEWHAGLKGRVLDARRRECRLEQPLAELHLVRAVEIHAAHVEIDQKHRVDIVAEPDVAHVIQAAHEQPRSDEQDDGECPLHNEQRDAQVRALIHAFACSALEISGEVGAAGLENGC